MRILSDCSDLLAEKARAREKTDVTYASMARVIREGGFKIVLYARLSAIPGHLTTVRRRSEI